MGLRQVGFFTELGYQRVLDPSKAKVTPSHVMTDGIWVWPYDLAYYVEAYHILLPEEFVAHVRSVGWIPRPVPDEESPRLAQAFREALA